MKLDMGITNLLIFFIDYFGFLVSLEPHHVLGVKSPTLLLQRFSSQVLRLRAFHVVEDEEQRLSRQSLVELQTVGVRQR